MTRQKSPPDDELVPMEPGEEEAMLLALACFCANITSADLDHMTGDAREWLRTNISLSVEQFHAACLYVADYQRKFAYGLALIRAGDASGPIDEPLEERLQ